MKRTFLCTNMCIARSLFLLESNAKMSAMITHSRVLFTLFAFLT